MHAHAEPGLSLPLRHPSVHGREAMKPSAEKLSWAKARMRPQPDTGWQAINMNSLDNSLELFPCFSAVIDISVHRQSSIRSY